MPDIFAPGRLGGGVFPSGDATGASAAAHSIWAGSSSQWQDAMAG
eukprot:CAMPEP_0204575388 /NCGR_PEP_ID=MMETSP0661-20131031/41164_1 /ASSEMBLY_ACC=CAM_ASM_000606 /TAXON_ID=109239 /ORGANISM="Alexandrium margalefi, Strain AMGDE01CS-322" /LENGTH=44 /DNA_ID= /DNA_START= /DNA_END= /DNA_ORIENTATION=